jgi:hypothetical protein
VLPADREEHLRLASFCGKVPARERRYCRGSLEKRAVLGVPSIFLLIEFGARS